MKNDIYEAWKPIRNFLRRVDPKISLEVLRYYSLFNGSLNEVPPAPPSYIEVNKDVLNRGTIGILPWDIELLAKEIVYSSDEGLTSYRYDLRKWRDFANLMQKLRALDNRISEVGISQSNVLMEMFRIAHRQFPHQQDTLNAGNVVRYGKLFTHPQVRQIVLDKIGLPYEKLIAIGIGYGGIFKDYAAITQPTEGLAGTNITLGDLNTFLALYSKGFAELKSQVSTDRVYDNTFMYQYSPLNASPLVRFERGKEVTYVCTSVNRLSFQVTKGVYYMLFDDTRFDNAFGNAFEEYVGEILTSTVKDANGCMVYSQEVDTSDNKRRCDWILEQGDEFIMVECKTKRMAMGGYVNLDDESIMLQQLGILADAVVQTYEGYLVYKGAGYSPPVYAYNKNKKGAVCVVTLEKWYLYGEPLSRLRKVVEDKLTARGINPAIIEEAPYEVMGVDAFESLTYLAASGESVMNIFTEHSMGEEASHEFSTYIFNQYKNALSSYKYVFANDIDSYIESVKGP